MPPSPTPTSADKSWNSFALLLICLLAVLAVQFHPSLIPEQMLFANDGPLGLMMGYAEDALSSLAGTWQDLSWIGGQAPSGSLNFTNLLLMLVGPVAFIKIYAPATQLLLGLCAWIFFRQLRFNPLVCVLAGLAAGLNMDAFSRGCWGVGTWNVAWAMMWLAMAALVSPRIRHGWLKAALAGAAVGLGVSEGFDTGAIYSLYAAAFGIAVPWLLDDAAEAAVRTRRGILSVILMAVFAGIVAAQTVNVLVSTQIKGVAGIESKDAAAKEERYNFATQWSLPKAETLRLIIPGLFGYRMLDQYTRDPASVYWGTVGQDPLYEEHRKAGIGSYPRHSGSGEYAGVLVVLIAIWAGIQAFRGDKGPFTLRERKFIWFWLGVAVFSLVMAWGRHAPLYRLFYSLPFASTIRSPIKFMHQVHLGLLVLFGFGLQGLWRRYIETGAGAGESITAQVKLWWARVGGFDRQWTIGCGMALGASLLAWMFFSASRPELVAWLKNNGFDDNAQPGVHNWAEQVAAFSSHEIGWFILFFALSVLFVTCIVSGALAGRRATFAVVMLGVLLVTDLSRANAPWIIYYNYKDKYASNAIIDTLRDKPWEHRATALQTPFYQFYHQEWLQHQFPFYHIQSLDIAQEPRPPQEKIDYRMGFTNSPLRYWQLTNTRFFLGPAGVNGPQGPVSLADLLNVQIDPARKRFRLHTAFTLSQERADAPILARAATNGQYALIEFTGALPRAALYSHWIVTNRAEQLPVLAGPAFDPEKSVLVEEALPTPPPAAPATNSAGEVKFLSYASKRIRLSAKADGPCLLLLNDRYDPNWKARVDGQPAPVVRCNYIMRGVHLAKGEHTVEFRFQPQLTSLYLSVAGFVVALVLCGLLLFERGGTTVGTSLPPQPPLSSPPNKSKPAK
ncbi:MAG: YfhO family protein [Verrucomicrobia bacterium]|nr:YfhO family protein [Verrucomicrobiota bacterium]